MQLPRIIQVVAFPILSTRIPNRGVPITVQKGIIDTIQAAVSTSSPNLGMMMEVANFLNEMMQQ